MRTPFTGVGTALITPFTRAGAVDEAAVRRLARRQIDAGVHFLVPCGTTGETPTLSARRAPPRRRAGASRKRPGGCRCSPAPAATTRKKSCTRPARCRRLGVQGLLSVTPYYNKPTPEGLVSALQGDRRRDAAADRALQRARAHRLQHRSGDLRAARDDPDRCRREGSLRQRSADGRDLPRRAGRLPRAFGRRCADAAADGDRRARDHLGGVERDSRRDGADGRSGRARRLRGGARASTRGFCR